MINWKVIRFWLILTLTILGLWLFSYAYEHLWGNADGLIANFAYENIFIALLILNGLGLLLTLGLTVRQKIIQNVALSILSGLFFIFLLEGIGHLVIGLKLVNSSPFVFRRLYIPSEIYKLKPFPAGDLNPVTGRAHVPNATYKFMNCEGDSIRWVFNSAGANDRQRSINNTNPTKKRISIVGDSFLEGYMVDNVDRCSNILEQRTGLEHLNFAVNSSSPLNYYLTYKSISKAYGADVVIIGFLPANDFEVYNGKQPYTLVDWPIYVPYWQGVYPNYTLRYSLANVSQSINYGNHTQTSLLRVVDSVYATLPLSGKLKADLLAHSSVFRLLGEMNTKNYKAGQSTKYELFSDSDWNYVNYSLTKLIEEAKGKKVIILSIPTLWDLKALKKGKNNRIDPLLAKFCRQKGVDFIPLAPSFLNYKGNPEQLYVPCDGHWSVKGESYAANVLLNHPIYRSAIK